MSIAESLEALKQPTSKEVAYTPKTEFDGQSGFIQTGPLSDAPKKHEEILELFGYDPKEVQIVGNPRVSRWQTYDERWLSAYKFQLAPVAKTSVDELVKLVGRRRAHKPVGSTGVGVFNFQSGDQQLGKIDGAAFDKAYIDNEVVYHRQVNGALETLLIPSAKNVELKSLLETGLKLFQGHQQHAEHLAAGLQ